MKETLEIALEKLQDNMNEYYIYLEEKIIKHSELITKEGIEGLGFELEVQNDVGFYLSSGNLRESVALVVGEYIQISDSDDGTLFLGKLNTIQELKTVLKQVGVL